MKYKTYFRNFEDQTFGGLQHNLGTESEAKKKKHQWVSSSVG